MKIIQGFFIFLALVLLGVIVFIASIYSQIQEVAMKYLASRLHRFIFILVIALVLTMTVAVASDGTLLAERSCAYKGINCQCLLVEADDRFYIVAKKGDEIIAVYEVVAKETGSEVILLGEYGVSI